jgi:hypothetical protein
MKRKHRIAFRRVVSRTFVLGPLAFLLVAGAGCPSLFESPTVRATRIRQAVPGKDLDGIITAADTVVNRYAQLAGTVNPAVGDKVIMVTDVNANFLSAVSQGDLLLIVQMAGAAIDTTTNDSSAYGVVTDLGSAGRYEFVGVESKANNQITLACGLKNGYSRAGKTQVIRVPQYATLTINNGASITAPAWNGVTGGIVAIHAETTTLQPTGSIDVSAKGFRGGYNGGDNTLDNASTAASTAGNGVILYRSALAAEGAEKGEGIAGYQGDYTNGRYGRGAPANGGGGGNSHNSGGGGGANASALAGEVWNGQGVMLGTFTTDPWSLDPGYLGNGGARTTSVGGGRGGYSYSNINLDALTNGPGLATWGGDARRDVGGLGGRPVPNSPFGVGARLFMGGGGGAGDGNDNPTYGGGHGGNGGGLVFLIAGSIAGTGSILANGDPGADMPAGAANGDAPGGGGGGGTVVVHATSLSAVTISVKGGKGGDHLGSSGPDEVEGPGGGGGGGYIAVSGSGTPVLSATGGPAGITDRTALAEFQADGATAGNAGQTDGNVTTFLYCGGVVTSFATHPTSTTTSTIGTFTFTNTSDPVTYECQLTTPAGTGSWAPCSGLDAGTGGYATGVLTAGDYTLSVRATDTFGNIESPPATFPWTVLGLDAGVDAESPAVDVGVDGGGSAEASPTLVDAEAIDVLGSEDLVSADDTATAEPDVAPDTAVVKNNDTAPIVFIDAAVDTENADRFLPALDVGEGIDTQVLPVDVASADAANADVQADTQPSGAEPKADTAPLPEPNRDSAGPIVKEDAAISPVNKDAALAVEDKILGSGFCAVSGSRSNSPAPTLLMGLAALAILYRRRKLK